MVLIVIAVGVLATVLPTLHSTLDVVFTLVVTVLVVGFILFIWASGGGGGGWPIPAHRLRRPRVGEHRSDR